MSQKIAYIGLSTPLAYDYEWESELGHPNPILEAPLGIFLLYDEIWFLRPELCPKNMRELQYVNFISDSDDLSDYREEFENLSDQDILGSQLKTTSPNIEFSKRVKHVAPFARYDNHGRNLPEVQKMPNPDVYNFLFDYYLSSKLGRNVEYITNSFVRGKLNSNIHRAKIKNDIETAERVIAENIPNYQGTEGPYFEKIDEFREFNTRSKFREKIENASTADEIRREFESVQNQMTIRATEKSNVYQSIMSAIVGNMPGISPFLSLLVEGKDIVENYSMYDNYGWANFIAKVEEETKSVTQNDS